MFDVKTNLTSTIFIKKVLFASTKTYETECKLRIDHATSWLCLLNLKIHTNLYNLMFYMMKTNLTFRVYVKKYFLRQLKRAKQNASHKLIKEHHDFDNLI